MMTLLLETYDDVKILLDLADDPKHDVVITSVQAIQVPDELYKRFLTYKSLDSEAPGVTRKKEKP